MLVRLVIVLALLANVGSCAKILGIAPFPSYSHQMVFQPLFRELSLRGHQVTVLMTDPINDPTLTNLTEIDLHFSYELWNGQIMENILKFNSNPLGVVMAWYDLMIAIQDQQLSHPDVQALINGEERFDVMIVEAVMPAMFGFAEKFKCPYIAMLSLDAFTNWYKIVGNPTHPVLYPDILFPFDPPLTFWQRITVVVGTPIASFLLQYQFDSQDRLIKNYFGPNSSHISDILSNIDMLFLNTDPIFHLIKPLVPKIIQIGGGSHMKPQKPLPTELKIALDNATSGFIYFSLGTNVKGKDIPAETRDVILATFSELPFTVLWKFEAEHLLNKPDNVIISPWLPQQDVLRHPNVKLFVTQGGLQSLEEAIFSGVPVVMMPFFGDQALNAKRLEVRGVGVVVDYATLTKKAFREAILEVLNNRRYQNRAKELANLARDQPMTGLERAVWWTEYVIRHNGTAHLRSPLLDIPWYQYLLLDVLAVILAVCLVAFYVCYVLVRCLLRCLKQRRQRPKTKIQ